MIRDRCNVREVPHTDGPTPLSAEEEQRCRSAFFSHIGNEIAAKGWARFPAYTPEERRRLHDVGRALSEYWGRPVRVEAEDVCAVLFTLEDAALASGPGA
ncbi:hypothetical protein [Streptomyces formicae]|uniref:Uncharacterized protein n=1 Tax=Streptomyces formicae TaxID=1616117 RepID=A0ABY3WQ17_9ACTN|nr:hypothetical protein [Streptomyces formicae]UNM14731.1 hypothetical protein J4032_27625 [Streptomyces formicae]